MKKYKDSAKIVTAQIKPKEVDASKTAKKSNDTKKLKSKSNEKLTTNKKEPGTVNSNEIISSESKLKRLENNVTKNEVQPKKSHQLKTSKNPAVTVTTKTKTKPSSDLKESQNVTGKDGTQKEGYNKKDADQSNKFSITDKTKGIDDQLNIPTSKSPLTQSSDQEFQGKLNSSYTIVENELNSSLSSQDLMEVENKKPTDNFVENKTTDEIVDEISQNTISVVENTILPITGIETLTRDDSIDIADKNNEPDKSKTNTDNGESISSSRKKTDGVRPPSVRPSSSRPGAPRLREKIDNVIPDSGSLLLAKVNIITEYTNNEDVSFNLTINSW